MTYDYVSIKPPLNEDTLAHYGVKGMKWKKRLKGKYYKTKSKIQGALANTKGKNPIPEDFLPGLERLDSQYYLTKKKMYGRANFLSGQEGAKRVKTTKLNIKQNRVYIKKDRPNHLSGQTGSRKITTTKVRKRRKIASSK